MSQAVRICPDLIILPGRRKDYSQKSKQVMKILGGISSVLEQISIDEAFLDVTSIQKNTNTLAREIQNKIMKETGLPCSLGIASNKLVAKIATDVGKKSVETKTYPQAVHIVPSGNEAKFLSPLPLEMLWGVGPKTASKLMQIGINTIGDLANWPPNDLVQRFGKIGYDLHRRANGIDNRDVVTYREPKSFSQEITFDRDTTDLEKIKKHLRRQSESLQNNLRKNRLHCSTIKLKIRWADFSIITRQITLSEPTDDMNAIYKNSEILLNQNWNKKDLIRLIGIGVANFHQPEQQLGLWDQRDYKKIAKLESALYQVKSKYGANSIFKGSKPPDKDKKADHE
jgi:DNA polymerase-4